MLFKYLAKIVQWIELKGIKQWIRSSIQSRVKPKVLVKSVYTVSYFIQHNGKCEDKAGKFCFCTLKKKELNSIYPSLCGKKMVSCNYVQKYNTKTKNNVMKPGHLLKVDYTTLPVPLVFGQSDE